MGKYKLCLIYSSNFYKPILDKEFSSTEEIDDITSKCKDEDELRKNSEIEREIVKIKNENWRYITSIKENEKRNGKIAIVDLENKNFTYFKPLYKDKIGLKSPKRLTSSIINSLKNENNGKVLSEFFEKFKNELNTEYTRINGVFKLNEYLRNINTPKTPKEKEAYKTMMNIIALTLKHNINKKSDTVPERVYKSQRRMLDYLEKTEYIKNLKVRDTNKIKKGKLNKEKSKKISIEQLYNDLVRRAYEASLESGEEPNLLGIYKGKFQKELDDLNWFCYGKRR